MSEDDAERRRRQQAEIQRVREQAARDKERGQKANQKGDDFHRGMRDFLGETTRNGWVREHEEGHRRLDNARIQDPRAREFTELKSGRVGEDARGQLRADRELLASGKYQAGKWITVKGEQMPKEVRQELERLARDFPGRFHHIEISRKMAQKALARGEALRRERDARQLEIPGISKEITAARERQALARMADTAYRSMETEAARRAQEREDRAREQDRLARVQAQEAREKEVRALGIPADIAKVIAAQQLLPGEQHRDLGAQPQGTTRPGREARARDRDGIAREKGP